MRRPSLAGIDVWLLLTLGVHVLLRALYTDFVPLYDSRQYFDQCLLPAASGPFELQKLNCFGHTTAAFMGLVLLVQKLDFGSVAALHATMIVLGVASIVAFERIAARMLPAPELAWERRVLVACYALGPTCLAGSVNFSPDYGVLAFFVLMLERLLARRFGMTAVWGTCLLFSKETGVLLYAAAIGTFVLLAWVRPRSVPPLRELARASCLMALPVAALAAQKLADFASGTHAVWGGERTEHVLLPMFLTFELLSPTFLAYAFDVLALGYKWILGWPLLLFTAVATARAICAYPALEAPGYDRGTARIVLVLTLLAFVLLTRFLTVNNVRYLFAVNPLFILASGYALSALGLRAALRRSVLGLALALTFSFNFHSIDPISRGFFGTFAFGKRELLRGATFDVCCGYGRDQIVYNFEFTQIHYLQNEAYRLLRPGPDTVLVAHKQATEQLAGRIDASFRRTLRIGPGTRELHILGVSDLLEQSALPPLVHFMELPNFDNRRAYARLRERYDAQGLRELWRGDFALRVHTLRLKR